jgi:hypothetical protein
MTEDNELDPEGQPQDDPKKVADPVRRALKPPGGDSEKALGLEMARLFGLPPGLLVQRPSRPTDPSTPQHEEATDSGNEPAEDGQGSD